MAINKKLIHFKKYEDFNSKKLSADENNTTYTIGIEGGVVTGEPEIKYNSICWIKDVRKMWTHGTLYNCSDPDLTQYLTSEEIEGLYVKKSSLSTVATSGSYNDLSGKPTIPSAVTESTVSGWGFTKNTGTITGIKMNGSSKGTSGVVDLGTVITAHQDISGKLDSTVAASTYATKTEVNKKQDKVLKFTNLAASQWISDSTYEGYPYRCDVTCSGVTADNYAEVVFALSQATSGSYAPLCETKANAVSIWSSKNTSITIPTILVTI